MWLVTKLVVTYVLGGFTFIPLLVVLLIAYTRVYGSVPVEIPSAVIPELFVPEDGEERRKLSAATSTSASQPTLSGWLTIRRNFPNATVSSTDKPPVRNVGSDAVSSLTAEEVGADTLKPKDDKESVQAQPSTYSARIMQGYKSIVESRTSSASSGGAGSNPPKEIFYCVLKGSVLFLYHDEKKEEVVAAIGVDRYDISVESPDDGGSKAKKDAEMFAKRNAIVLRIKVTDGKAGIPVLSSAMGLPGDKASAETQKEFEALPWYLFVKSNTRMEDWYTSLLAVSAANPKSTLSQIFNIADMQNLVDTLDSQADPIPMRWLNAMFGRIFFGLYRTKALEQFIIDRIMKKLIKVPRPGFLSPIVVREVNVGRSAPYFLKPMLKELTADGAASFEVNLHYVARPTVPNSEIRITIATTATIPTGFKPYVVDLVLAVVIKSFEGNLVLKIKKPPSNRVWYGFTTMPKMDIEIMPVVSERKIQIGMVLKAIEKQIRDAIAESVVLPNMDDVAFFDTSALTLRGGIFDEASKLNPDAPEGADITDEGLGPKPITPEQMLESISTDPTTLRKRKSLKSQSVTTDDVPDESSTEVSKASDKDLSRVDTAPPDLGSSPAASLLAGKKWFANKAAEAADATEGLTRTDGAAGEKRTIETSATESTSSTQQSSSISSSSRSTLGSSTKTTLSHSSKAPSIPSTTSYQSTAPSLIATLRTKAADKKALQSSVNEARDAVKKWGVNWAAKRKTGVDLDDKIDAPAADVRAVDEEQVRSRRSIEQLSLKDRLNAAAALSTSPTRSTKSRPATSPTRAEPTMSSRSSIKSLSSSPPVKSLFAPTVSKATTEVNMAEVSSVPPVVVSSISKSSKIPPLPVRHQPASSVSMVVPRIPHRPGSVTSLSSTPDDSPPFSGLDSVLADGKTPGAITSAPTLPPRANDQVDLEPSSKPPKLPERPETMTRSTSQQPLLSLDFTPGSPVAASETSERPALVPESRSISTPDVVAAEELRQEFSEQDKAQASQSAATKAADELRRVVAADSAAQSKQAVQVLHAS